MDQDLKNNPDIALLKLRKAVKFGPTLNVICLPTNPSRLYEEETMIVAGWGLTENLTISDTLMEADVKVYPNKKCKNWNNYDFLQRYDSFLLILRHYLFTAFISARTMMIARVIAMEIREDLWS